MAVTAEKRQGKDGEYMEITGADPGTEVLVIPETVDGIPVRSVGSNAFSRREDLREIRIPGSVRQLKGFAFYHCPRLERLSMTDSVEDYYDGVIRQCRNLSEISVTMQRENYRMLHELLGDNDRQVTFQLEIEDGNSRETVRLTFPEYVYNFQEDTMARAIHHKIEGAGYPFRECVSRDGIDFRRYDRLFFRISSYDTDTAVEIALNRLMYPKELLEEAKEQYRDFLREHGIDALRILIGAGDSERTGVLTRMELLAEEAVQYGIREASRERQTEICGLLMEYDRRKGAVGRKRETFSL